MHMSNVVRPDLERERTFVLDGKWEFGISSGDKEVFDSTIIVPFSPEAEKSGIKRTLMPYETMYYRKMVPLKKKENKRYILTFLAVDYYAKVFINSKEVARHSGGYLPFSIDITRHVKDGGFEIKLYVKDPSDTENIERGKQTLNPHRIWYPATSGIWQSVYLEEVENDYIEKIIVTPEYDSSSFSILAVTNARKMEKAILEIDEHEFEIVTDTENIIKLSNPHPWRPDDPYIYYFKIKYKNDIVKSYTALRKISIIKDVNGKNRIALNDKAIFCHGILDQGYTKKGLLTYENDEEIIKDLMIVKSMGFNTVRKHIKIESPSWYFHATRLGLLVWQDMVNAGKNYSFTLTTLPLFIPSIKVNDKKSKGLNRLNNREKTKYESFIKETISYLYSVPSIIVWTLFNEGWGQFDSSRLTDEIRKMDGTRLVDSASGWIDQGCGDFSSKHVYFRKYRYDDDKLGRAVVLSEFGGIGEGKEYTGKKRFTYKDAKNEDDLFNQINEMYERDVIANIKKGLSASIYTQLSDVEQETNGLVTYDRERVKVSVEKMKSLSDKILKR